MSDAMYDNRPFCDCHQEYGEGLIEALEWYAEQARLCRLIHSEGDAGRHAISEDGGRRAREALNPSKPKINQKEEDNEA